jgi:hypothetical protein
MPHMIDADLVEAAFASGQGVSFGRDVQFRVEELGLLRVPTGMLAASDPFIDQNPAPFTRTVPPGAYPVLAAIACYPDDERIAFARLKVADGPIVSWEMALVAGQDVASLGADDMFGYGVDAGTGCFMDADGGRALDARMTQEGEYYNVLIEGLEAAQRDTWSYLDVRPSEADGVNVICFSTGFGDGFYPTYFGLDEHGSVMSVVTDFLLIGDADPEEPSAVQEARADALKPRRGWTDRLRRLFR